MILRSFKSVAWVAGVGAAALSCYMLSLKVAAERAELAAVESRIVATQRAIRDLQTELGTRGRLQQLENWNAEVLALSAPAAGQFVENELLLARFETRETPAAVEAPVRMASAETAPQAGAPAAVQRAVAPAAPARAPSQPEVRRASLTTAPSPIQAQPQPRTERPKPAPATATAAARPAAQPRTPARSSLLDERTAREIGEAARAERSRPAATPARDRQSQQD